MMTPDDLRFLADAVSAPHSPAGDSCNKVARRLRVKADALETLSRAETGGGDAEGQPGAPEQADTRSGDEPQDAGLSAPPASTTGNGGWIIADADEAKFRVWDMGPGWTESREDALRFARRRDAEAFARDDEDAWKILPAGGLAPLAKDVADAMQSAWDEICDDTGCHPLDIEKQGRKLFFRPMHWAHLVAQRLDGLYRSGKRVEVAEGAEVVKPLANPCSVCGLPIIGGSFVGTGDGTMKDGGSFAHNDCYHRARADALAAQVETLTRERDDARADHLRVHRQFMELKYPGSIATLSTAAEGGETQ